jgi:hypothetical protein
MRSPADLSRETMEQILSQIQILLWHDTNAQGDFWNPEKEWDSETLEFIAGVLEEQELRPREPLPDLAPDRIIYGRGSKDAGWK